MYLINLPFILLGYIPKYLAYIKNGYAGDLTKGIMSAFKMWKVIDKPKFRLKNLPSYIWVEGQMIKYAFVYVDYRLRRALGKK